ncbi:hypothetical protein F4604DRAFT_1960926 [Suillus subluteus]|nr:hypothetical protein F4604DRAFT_1960926 [Suillus subluteus]
MAAYQDTDEKGLCEEESGGTRGSTIGLKNDEIEKPLERSVTYRKCRLERTSSGRKFEERSNAREPSGGDYGIDFDSLTEEERADNSPETTAEFYAQIAKLNREIERMAPNSKAVEKLDDVEAKLADTEKERS